jgi:hypothetical protein
LTVADMSHGNRQQTGAKRLRASVAAGLLGLAGSAALAGPQAAAANTVSPLPASNYGVRPVCGAPAPGHPACLALELVPETPAARAHTHPLGMTREVPAAAGRGAQVCELEPPTAANGCYGLRPQDLRSAYRLPGGAESPQTIAIVDPFNDPSAQGDLEKYDQEFGLPACTAQNGCFRQLNGKGEAGNLPFPSLPTREKLEAECKPPNHFSRCLELEDALQWDTEISLDIETAHAICQNCQILLVEAASPEYPELEEAEESAARLGATEISDSWGLPESQSDSQAFNHPGVVITAAAGDNGYRNWRAPSAAERGSVEYPASSPHVVAVGGTRLSLQEGAWTEEAVWNGQGATGGGCSQLFAAPTWQLGTSAWSSVGCGEKRAVADVSADADPYTGVAVYDSASKCEGHWCTLGGTSLSSPLIAAVFALAGGAHGVAYPARTLYENELDSPGSLHDVVAGSNGECRAPASEGIAGCSVQAEAQSCSQLAICLARLGYDGPSGVGTPNGVAAFAPFTATTKKSGLVAAAEPSPAAPSIAAPTRPPTQSHGKPSVVAITVRVSRLALTPRALAALVRARRSASQIGFTFSINAAAQVRATLAKRVRVRGRQRWKLLRDSLTIAAARGRNSRSLSGHGRLDPGSYRLTLMASHGNSPSIFFRIG